MFDNDVFENFDLFAEIANVVGDSEKTATESFENLEQKGT